MQLCESKGERYGLYGKGVRTAPFPNTEQDMNFPKQFRDGGLL